MLVANCLTKFTFRNFSLPVFPPGSASFTVRSPTLYSDGVVRRQENIGWKRWVGINCIRGCGPDIKPILRSRKNAAFIEFRTSKSVLVSSRQL